MNPLLIKRYLAASALLGLLGVLPWWMGGVVKGELEQVVAELKQLPNAELSDYRYDRGWGSSSIKMKLAFKKDDAPIILDIHHHMTHRPWTLLTAFAQGVTKITVSSKSQAFQWELNQGQELFLKSSMSLTKTMSFEGVNPSVRLADPVHQIIIRLENARLNAKLDGTTSTFSWAVRADSLQWDASPVSWQGLGFRGEAVLSKDNNLWQSKESYAFKEWKGYESQTGAFCYITEPSMFLEMNDEQSQGIQLKANRLAINQDVYGVPTAKLVWNDKTRTFKLLAESLSPEGKLVLKGQGFIKHAWTWTQPLQWNRTMEATGDLQAPTALVEYWMQLLTRHQMSEQFSKNALHREPSDKEVASLSQERIGLWLHDNMVHIVDNDYQFKLGVGQGLLRFNEIPVRNLSLSTPEPRKPTGSVPVQGQQVALLQTPPATHMPEAPQEPNSFQQFYASTPLSSTEVGRG